jgi:hypothetical protein
VNSTVMCWSKVGRLMRDGERVKERRRLGLEGELRSPSAGYVIAGRSAL